MLFEQVLEQTRSNKRCKFPEWSQAGPTIESIKELRRRKVFLDKLKMKLTQKNQKKLKKNSNFWTKLKHG
jgi:hypothetical protein